VEKHDPSSATIYSELNALVSEDDFDSQYSGGSVEIKDLTDKLKDDATVRTQIAMEVDGTNDDTNVQVGKALFWIPHTVYTGPDQINSRRVDSTGAGTPSVANVDYTSTNATTETDQGKAIIFLVPVGGIDTNDDVFLTLATSGGGNGAICFLQGTPVVTDQGEMAIEDITADNTIEGQAIVGITKQSLTEDLVLFKQNCLEDNVPSQDTYVTKDHGLFINNVMIKASTLVDGENIVKVNVGSCNVYNVLLETHEKMLVNNLVAETLEPDHPAAKYALMDKAAPKTETIAKRM
jgi:hypothetical protein